MATPKRLVLARSMGEGGITRWSTETTVYGTVVTDTCHLYTRLNPQNVQHRVKSNVNYGLCITMCQCRFISCNKCTTLVRDVDNGGDCAYGRGGGRVRDIWELCAFCSICCEPKSALKK